jgi:tetratricopeptide (TPR) repeat protein
MNKRMVSAILGMLMPIALIYGGGMDKPAPAEGNAFKAGKAALAKGGKGGPLISLESELDLYGPAAAEEIQETLPVFEQVAKKDKIATMRRKAAEEFRVVFDKNPTGDMADDALSHAATHYYGKLNNTKQAMGIYEQLIERYPNSKIAEEAASRMGAFYMEQKQFEKAIKSYKDFIYNFPKNTNVEAAKFNIAECYEKLGKWENAIDSYQEYINAYPQGKRMAEAKEQINWIRAYNL